MVFTFWEGKMPPYIKMCMRTWKVPFVLLTYKNLWKYTSLPESSLFLLQRFPLSQVSDVVRAHVLRDNVGSYWLDADTIMLTDKLPQENVIGNPIYRTHSTGVCHNTETSIDFFEKWAEYQEHVISDPEPKRHWSLMVNMFTDTYIPEHEEITIYDIGKCRPELYISDKDTSCMRYLDFYFDKSYMLQDIKQRLHKVTQADLDFLVLHNSWTLPRYKVLSEKQVLNTDCTLSNILKEVLWNTL